MTTSATEGTLIHKINLRLLSRKNERSATTYMASLEVYQMPNVIADLSVCKGGGITNAEDVYYAYEYPPSSTPIHYTMPAFAMYLASSVLRGNQVRRFRLA